MNLRSLRVLWSGSLCVGALACGAVGQSREPSAPRANACGGAQSVALTNEKRAGDAFVRLAAPTTAPLQFGCSSDAPCSLPSDTAIEVRARFKEPVACEFAACRVPYAFASLPFEVGADEPCPPVLWSLASIQLKTNAGTVDLTGERASKEVNVLARADGAGYLRFVVESPASAQRWGASPQPRTVLLDIQIELTASRMRGQMSALAAPLPQEPASELRFTSLWTATWEAPRATDEVQARRRAAELPRRTPDRRRCAGRRDGETRRHDLRRCVGRAPR